MRGSARRLTHRMRAFGVSYSTALLISAGIVGQPPARRRISGDPPIVRVQVQELIDDHWDPRELLGDSRQAIVLGWDPAASPRELVSPN